MEAFKNLPIGRKLTLIITLTTGAVIALAATLIIGYQFVATHLANVDDMRAVADVIAPHTAGALQSRAVERIDRTLAVLEANPDILAGRVFDKDGNLVASYTMPGNDVVPVGLEPKGDRHWFDGRYLVVSHPILAGSEPVGTLVLVGDHARQQSRLQYSILVVVLLMLAAIGVSALLAARLQKVVSRPIRNLAALVHAVAQEKNYALRAVPESRDETGTLADAFNQMLGQIQKQDEELRASERRFRQMTETISQVFWLTDVEKKQMIYVSPAYEEIWGRTCDSLYRSARDWLEAIHPDDRARVVEAAQTKQACGEYDEEYRIVRPTGSIRWIRDRAFPIQEPNGEVHRIAGVAEDITDRRLAEEGLRLQGEIARNMEEGISLVRARDGVIVYANPKFERLFGYGPGELVGQPVELINARSVRSPENIAREIVSALKRGGNWNGEVHNRKKNGTEFWCHANVSSFDHPEYGPVWISVHTDITERKRAEKKLQEAEAKYRLLVERVPAITYIAEVGQKGLWQYISPQVERILGFSAEEWLADRGLWLRQIHPHDRAQMVMFDEQSLATGKFSQEYRFVARDGRVVWCRDEGVLVRDVDGGPPLMQGVIYDVTERKRAEQTLRSQQQEQQAILNSAPALIWYKDCHNRIIRLNQSAAASMGKTIAEVEGRHVEELYPDEAAKYYRDDLEVINSGQPKLGIIEQLLTASGEKRWIQTDKAPFFNERGEIIGLIVCAVDVTERKQIEQALHTQARVLENMVEGVLVYDDHDRITFTNHALDAMFGYARGELIGQSTFGLNPFPPETSARIAKEIRHHLETHASLEREYINRRKDGSEFVSESRVSRLQIDGQWRQVAVVQDVTKRKWMEKEILEVSDREQRRIGQDLHDGLCQLLTGTTFAIKTLEQKLQAASSPAATEAGEIAELLRRANVEARNIARGLHPLELDAGGLVAALHELAFNVQGLFNVDCRFHCEQPIDLADKGKAIHVYRIAQEAVNNALKHSQAKHIGITLTPSDGNVTLTVDDDGVGLPEQFKGSTGMGLNIMAYRARMIGGSLQVHSGDKRGIIVSLVYPGS